MVSMRLKPLHDAKLPILNYEVKQLVHINIKAPKALKATIYNHAEF